MMSLDALHYITIYRFTGMLKFLLSFLLQCWTSILHCSSIEIHVWFLFFSLLYWGSMLRYWIEYVCYISKATAVCMFSFSFPLLLLLLLDSGGRATFCIS